ncbi:MAG TPA: carboxypeptidase regulatory-like domain-containing protein [Bryobacteraceae bacterium]|nr:carboxypeptidase regulatory-like domain-containing protein [Bryobacteraceae bacterium]
MNFRRIPSAMFAALLCAAVSIAPPRGFAQTLTTGDISGHVIDATNAVVPNATLTLKSDETNESRTATTNGSGEYRFSLLSGGEYTLTAIAAGLKPTVRKVTVQIGQNLGIDIPLSVQGNSEVVEVSAEAAILQTEDANLTTTFSTERITDLPMAGGDLTTLAMTVPGVRVAIKGGSGNMNANGVPGSSMLFTLNGADVMDPYNNLNNSGASNNLLGANEVAEAAVILNPFDAQYGRMAGGQENLVGKSGTNAFHGNANWNYNSQLFNARDFFVALTGSPKTRSDANLYGGLISGPVKKNKLFFLFDAEGLRYVLPATSYVTLPSPQLLNFALAHVPQSAQSLYQDAANLYKGAPGASSAVLVTNGTGPYQDSKGKLGCQSNGTFAGTPDGNGGVFGVTTPCAEVFTSSNNQLNTEALYTERVDWNINDKQKIYFRYNYDAGIQATGTSPIAPAFNSVSTQPQHAGQLNHSWVITPALVNNFVGAGSWYSAIFGVADFSKVQALMPERFSFADGGSNSGGFTGVGSGGGQGTAGFPNGRNVGQMQLIDDLSWNHGRHTIKTGVNYRFNKVTATNLSSGAYAGTYTFNDLADFAYGKINSTGKGSNFSQSFPLLGAAHIRAYSLNFYVQDEWNVSPNIKITYGMRFERDGNPACLDNCFNRLNVPFGASNYQGGASIPYNQTIVTGLHNAYAGLEAIIPEPRFSVAWTPFGSSKTVIRGGIGLLANLFAVSVANSIDTNPPEVFTPSVTTGNVGLANDPSTSLSIAAASAAGFQTGFSKGYTLAQIQAGLPTGVSFAKPGFYSTPNDFVAPKILQWNFNIEQPLWSRDVFSITYTGNHGYDESLTNANANAFIASNSVYASTGYAHLPFVAPDARFLTVNQVLTSGKSNYSAMIMQLRHAFSHGFQGQIGYTWSHALGNNAVYDPNNIHLGYGPLSFDTRHMVSGDMTYDSPKFSNRFWQIVLGNWTIGNKLYVYSGSPFSVTNSALAARINSAGGISSSTFLADVIDPSVLGISCAKTITGSAPCLTSASFATTAAQMDFGNTAPNMFRGAGYFDIDTMLLRNIPVKEKYRFSIGAQFYNLLNHPNFANPCGSSSCTSVSVTSSSLGFISSTVVPPTSIYGSFQSGTVSGRVIVMNAKFQF